MAGYVERFGAARVLVLGDVMLDRYFWGQVDRISPEAPVPVVRVTRRSSRLGGAANVAANLRSLGAQVALAGSIGDDRAGGEIRTLLGDIGIDGEHLGERAGLETTEKVRIIAQSQQVVRADFEAGEQASAAVTPVAELRGLEKRYDALVISDYGKGVLQKDTLPGLIASWRAAGKPVLVDPYVRHFRWYNGATVVTPNTKEAASFFDATVGRDELFGRFGFQIRAELELDALLITRGEEGMSLFLSGDEHVQIPAVAKEVYDVTGAGDTVIAVLAAMLAAGAPMLESVVVANQGAGEAVKEIGTAVVSGERLINAFGT